MSIALEQTVTRLQSEFGQRLSVETIEQYVQASLDDLSDARIKTYVPIFTFVWRKSSSATSSTSPN